MSNEYRQQTIPANYIAALLGAGYANFPNKFAIFTGGGNGNGKTTFLNNTLAPELNNIATQERDINNFYSTLRSLSEHGELFGEYFSDELSGQDIWENITQEFPELKAIETYPIPYLNLDLAAMCLPEARKEKREKGENFLISEHYYRALNHMPELCAELTKQQLPFVADSTMSNYQKTCDAMHVTAAQGYRVNAAIFYVSPQTAIKRAEERQAKDGRIITRASLMASQEKMPINLWRFVEAIFKIPSAFLGIFSGEGNHKLISYTGQKPYLAALNPESAIKIDCPGKLYSFDCKTFQNFRTPFYTAR